MTLNKNIQAGSRARILAVLTSFTSINKPMKDVVAAWRVADAALRLPTAKDQSTPLTIQELSAAISQIPSPPLEFSTPDSQQFTSCALPFYRGTQGNIAFAPFAAPDSSFDATIRVENLRLSIGISETSASTDAVHKQHLALALYLASVDSTLSLAQLLHVDLKSSLDTLQTKLPASQERLYLSMALVNYVSSPEFSNQTSNNQQKLYHAPLSEVLSLKSNVPLYADVQATMKEQISGLALVSKLREYLGTVDETKIPSDSAYCKELVSKLAETTNLDALELCEELCAQSKNPITLPSQVSSTNVAHTVSFDFYSFAQNGSFQKSEPTIVKCDLLRKYWLPN